MKTIKIKPVLSFYKLTMLLAAFFFTSNSMQAQDDLFVEMRDMNAAFVKGRDLSFKDGYLYYIGMDNKVRRALPTALTPVNNVSTDNIEMSAVAGTAAIEKSDEKKIRLLSNNYWGIDNTTSNCTLITLDKKTEKIYHVANIDEVFSKANPWTKVLTLPKEPIDFAVYDGRITYISEDYNIYTKGNGPSINPWVNITNSRTAKKVTYDVTGRLWIVGSNNFIYYKSGNSWIKYGNNANTAKDIVVPNKTPIVIGSDDILHIGTKEIN